MIYKNNTVAKNICSPYMRTLYHILKLSSLNTSNKIEMKQYTNIVRSIIPYDILIAINSMFFYKNKTDNENIFYRYQNLDPKNDSVEYITTNDYFKYYNYLIDCVFFDHLIMNFNEIKSQINKHSNTNIVISHLERVQYKLKKNNVLYGITHIKKSIQDIYIETANYFYDLDTDVIIGLFYKSIALNSDEMLRFKMKNLIERVDPTHLKLTKPYKNIYLYNVSIYSIKNHSLNIGDDFLTNFVHGILIKKDDDFNLN